MLAYPEIDPIALSLGPVHVRWYGLMYVLGFLGGWWVARRRAALPGSTWKAVDVDDLIFFAALGVIIGAFARNEGEPDVGKFTLTLRRGDDGRWLIMSDMDNGNRR